MRTANDKYENLKEFELEVMFEQFIRNSGITRTDRDTFKWFWNHIKIRDEEIKRLTLENNDLLCRIEDMENL